jgi:hypothetical protein
MARQFPTDELWASLTAGRIGSGGSAEFKRLNTAFLAYANARRTKGREGQSISDEYRELKTAFDAYTLKKQSNENRLHLLGKVDRNRKGVLKQLGDFLASNTTAVSAQEDMAMIDYAFQRSLRMKTALANARVEIKPSSYLETFKAAYGSLQKIKKKGLFHSNSLLEDLQEAAKSVEEKSQRNGVLQTTAAHLQTGQQFYSQAGSAQAKLKAAYDLFHGHVAQSLNVTQDEVFKEMIGLAQQTIGTHLYEEIVSLIPMMNTVVGGAKVLKGLYDASVAYSNWNRCGEVRRTIIAPGDPNSAFEALEKLLKEEFNRATQAYAEGAIAFVAGLDPSQTASSVVGAATAVAHLLQDMVSFGLNYYQMLAVNRILNKWSATPLDGEMSIAFGLNATGPALDRNKARRAASAANVQEFTDAIHACPLLGCYYITTMPALDLLEMVAADIAYESSSSFFQLYLDINSEKVEGLSKLAKSRLDASRFRVSQNRGELHDLRSSLEAQNFERHQKMHADRKATLEAFGMKHVANQRRHEKEYRKATLEAFGMKHVANQQRHEKEYQEQLRIEKEKHKSLMRPVFLELLEARKNGEEAAAATLEDLLLPSSEVDYATLQARQKAVVKAMDLYTAQTSGIHRLHTVRNSESTEARAVLTNLIKQGIGQQTLIKLDAVVSYLISSTPRPTEFSSLRALRDASRLKRLLREEYERSK